VRELNISGNGRYLVQGDGKPFLWIGDTLWRWHLLDDAEQDEYLDWRRQQGYTLVQLALADERFTIGEQPFLNRDPATPNLRYWLKVDRFLEKIGAAGLYAAPVLMWGQPKDIDRLTPAQLYTFARWAGHRYRDLDHLVWLTLGEATHPNSPAEKVMAALNGLREGDTGQKLVSIHANMCTTSSLRFHDVVDFNIWQTSQFCAHAGCPR
jgi:hypothetical protein